MTTGIVFKARSGGRLKVDEVAVQRLTSYRQVGADHKEAGGVLLGRYLLDCADIVVDAITEPLAEDKRSRFSFWRSKHSHQRRIDDAWQASQGTCVYLGEWHTHPEPFPTPSPTDLGDWRRRLRSDKFDGTTLYFLILGTCELRAWEGTRVDLAIVPMEQTK